MTHKAPWLRRARPLLGTLVEIGAPGATAAQLDAGFEAIAAVQRALSRFDAHSDVARFAALQPGQSLAAQADTLAVLAAAATLQHESDGLFDVSLGSGPHAWQCAEGRLHKRTAGVQLDLGGIGKGHAVDRAVAALQAAGVAAGCVNAGGDLRVFGPLDLPVRLRNEVTGVSRDFLSLGDGAFATSHYSAGSRCTLHGAPSAQQGLRHHVSVAAPTCLWADALTKVAALAGPACQPLLNRLGATAWWH